MLSLSKAWTRHWSLALLLLGLLALQLDLGLAAEEDAMDADDEDELGDDDDEDDELGEEVEEGDYEDDEDAAVYETRMPPSAPAVHAGVMVVSHSGDSGAEIQLGDPVEVICGFRNTGAEALNVTHMLGSLSNPANFFEYLDNFTEVAVNRESDPNTELSLDYRFKIPQMGIRAGPVQMSLTVFYQAGSGEELQNFSTTFYNQTIELVEAPSAIDQKTLLIIIVVAALGGVAYVLNERNVEKRKVGEKVPSMKRSKQSFEEDKQKSISMHIRSGAGGVAKSRKK